MERKLILGGSVSCFDLSNLERQMEHIHRAPIDFLHYDVVDGRFNNCIILGSPLLKALRKLTALPIEVHLAVYEPERLIPQFVDAGADIISVHPEGTEDLASAFDLIRRCGAKPALALRCETDPSEEIIYAAREAAYIIKLTVNPGFSGQKINPSSLKRMKALHDALIAKGIETRIAADGNVNALTIPEMVAHGAGMLIGGTSGLFLPGRDVSACAEEMLFAFYHAGGR